MTLFLINTIENKNVNAPIFKQASITLDEKSILIKQLLCDEDEADLKEQCASI